MRPMLNGVLLAVGNCKRVRLQQAARAQCGLPAAQVLEWRDWLAAPQRLDDLLRHAPSYFKIEPPGEDAHAQHMLLQRGSALLQCAPVAPLLHAELRANHIWFAGLRDALLQLERQLAQLRQQQNITVCNSPHDIVLMGDKLACQQHLAAHQLPIPPLFGEVENYDHLQALLVQHDCRRVYLKSRYGSSAAGVLAYRRHADGREQITTSAQLLNGRLFNNKRVQRYERQAQIVELVNLLCAQHAYAERWISKPRIADGHFDVRVLTLDGVATHRVARIGRQALTNLHLDNQRAEVAQLVSAQDISRMEHCAAQAAASFAASRVTGFDMIVKPGQIHILEANAFGDLLPGLLWQGQEAYAAQWMVQQ